jgi:DNA modification methylase
MKWKDRMKKDACWQIICGDVFSVLPSLQADYFSCVVTSPPYFWQRDYEVVGQIGQEASIDEYVESISNAMDEVKRVLSPTGVLFLNLGDTYYSGKGKPHGHDPKQNGRRLKLLRAVDASGLGVPQKSLIGIPWRVAIEMISRDWVLRAPIVWRREKALPEPSAKDRPWRTYEFVFLFCKNRKYEFSRDLLKINGFEDVWTIEARANGRGHPAVFPKELVRRCLEIGNPKRGPVLDPFAGSGTVIDAALDLGMSAVGIDLNSKFCKGIVNRLEGRRA